MRSTKNSLTKEVRTAVCEFLNEDLAILIDLMLMTKKAHWNVRGDGFLAIHRMFDEIAEGIEEHVDDVAERIVALGCDAIGTASDVCDNSPLKDYPADDLLKGVAEHVKALTERVAVAANTIRGDADKAEAQGDQATLELLAGVVGSLDKYLWFLEAQAS
jgi:starvation-inducible DNA-binding protein